MDHQAGHNAAGLHEEQVSSWGRILGTASFHEREAGGYLPPRGSHGHSFSSKEAEAVVRRPWKIRDCLSFSIAPLSVPIHGRNTRPSVRRSQALASKAGARSEENG